MSRSRHFISLTEKLALSYLLVSLLIILSMALLLYFALRQQQQVLQIREMRNQHHISAFYITHALNTNGKDSTENSNFSKNAFVYIRGKSYVEEFHPTDLKIFLKPDIAQGFYTLKGADSLGRFILKIRVPNLSALYPARVAIHFHSSGNKYFQAKDTITFASQTTEISTSYTNGDKELTITSVYSPYYHIDTFTTVLKFVLIGIVISGFIFIYAYFTGRKIAQPLRALTEAAGKTQSGNFLVVEQPQVNDEIGQLAQAFNEMTIRLRKQGEELEKERIRRLKAIIDSQELERKRVAKELHEGLAQDVVGLKFMISRLNLLDDINKLKEQLPQIEKFADNMVDQIRLLSNKLSPTVLSGYGLGPALRFLAEESEHISGIKIHMDTTGLPARIGGKLKTYLYRIVQETLQNAMSQRSVRHISVSFATDITRLYIFVQDDGQGFQDYRMNNPGYGVYSMQERIELLGGNLKIESEAGKGTRVTISIPFKSNVES